MPGSELIWLLIAYVVLLIYHASAGKRETTNLADYYVGGRSMGGVALGLSFFATFSSTNSFVGFAGKSFFYGLPWLLMAPFLVAACLLSWVFVAPRLQRFTTQLNSLTLPDFFGFRFGTRSGRLQTALLVLFGSLLYMTAIFKGIGNLLEVFLGIPYWLAILLVFTIVMLYTAVGGFISVVKTDAVQGVLLMVAAVVLFCGASRAAGGIGTIWETSQVSPATATHVVPPLSVLLGIFFAGSIKFLVEPRQLSRFYALRDGRAIRQGMWISTLAMLLVYSLLLPIGLYARELMPAGIQDSDLVIPTLLTSGIFPPLARSFLLLAMVAAAMSSLDSVLLVTASTCQRDVVGLWKQELSEERALRQTRFYVVLFAVATTLVALDPPGGIVSLTILSGSLYAACFFAPLMLGLFWRRGNGPSLMASYAAGLAGLFLWVPLGGSTLIHQVFPALLFSGAVYVVVARWSPSNRDPRIQSLFQSCDHTGKDSDGQLSAK